MTFGKSMALAGQADANHISDLICVRRNTWRYTKRDWTTGRDHEQNNTSREHVIHDACIMLKKKIARCVKAR